MTMRTTRSLFIFGVYLESNGIIYGRGGREASTQHTQKTEGNQHLFSIQITKSQPLTPKLALTLSHGEKVE